MTLQRQTSTFRNKKPQCFNYKPNYWENSSEILVIHYGIAFWWLQMPHERHLLWMDSILISVLHSPLSLHLDDIDTVQLLMKLDSIRELQLKQKSLHIPSARQILVGTSELCSAFSTQYLNGTDISYRPLLLFLGTPLHSSLLRKSKDNLKYNKGCS